MILVGKIIEGKQLQIISDNTNKIESIKKLPYSTIYKNDNKNYELKEC